MLHTGVSVSAVIMMMENVQKNQQHSLVFISASFEYQVWITLFQIKINLHDAVSPDESCDVALAYSCCCNL